MFFSWNLASEYYNSTKKLTLSENTVIRSLVHATLWSLIWVAHYALLWLFCHCSVTSLTFECKFFFYKKKTRLWWDRHEAMPEGGRVQGPDRMQLDWSPLSHFLSFSSCFSHTSLREDPLRYRTSQHVEHFSTNGAQSHAPVHSRWQRDKLWGLHGWFGKVHWKCLCAEMWRKDFWT